MAVAVARLVLLVDLPIWNKPRLLVQFQLLVVGLKNFYAITRYNRSVMYAMAVHQLSDLLVQARGNK